MTCIFYIFYFSLFSKPPNLVSPASFNGRDCIGLFPQPSPATVISFEMQTDAPGRKKEQERSLVQSVLSLSLSLPISDYKGIKRRRGTHNERTVNCKSLNCSSPRANGRKFIRDEKKRKTQKLHNTSHELSTISVSVTLKFICQY